MKRDTENYLTRIRKKRKKMSSIGLHIFFFPFLFPGHSIPMVDLAKLFAGRGVKSTIIATAINAPQIQPTVDRSSHPIQLLTLPFSLPKVEAALTTEIFDAIDKLEAPLKHLLQQHQPDCIVSDVFYPWTVDLAAELDIPRIGFHGAGCFASRVMGTLAYLGPQCYAAESFVVPGIPHRIEIETSKLRGTVTLPDDMFKRISEVESRAYGTVMNTFSAMEPGYATDKQMRKVWHVGPLFLCSEDAVDDKTVRGGECAGSFRDCLNWLGGKMPGSVVYVCFGSLGQFTSSQLREMAVGLEASDHPFVWVVKKVGEDSDSEWMPEGFEERVIEKGKGLLIRGWAPQTLILNHLAVGGFVTHCGWNSSLEGVSAGVPMITWPLFGDQVFNEKLLVDVLRVAVPVGVKVCGMREEERSLVSSEEVKKAVNELMGSGDEADERRKRAKEIAAKAKEAVEEGGSSYGETTCLIQELVEIRKGRAQNT